MNWETVKTNKDATLDGIDIEIDKSDSSITSVTFTDKSGGKLRIRMDSYTMRVDIPAKPKTEKKWALKGEFKGLPVDETFDSEYQANNRRDDIDYGNKDLVVEEVEVEIPF
jgi:hypothetical protein